MLHVCVPRELRTIFMRSTVQSRTCSDVVTSPDSRLVATRTIHYEIFNTANKPLALCSTCYSLEAFRARFILPEWLPSQTGNAKEDQTRS